MFLYIYAAIVGMAVNLGLMWSIAETFNGLMAIFNPIAVLLLSGLVVKLVKSILRDKAKHLRKVIKCANKGRRLWMINT